MLVVVSCGCLVAKLNYEILSPNSNTPHPSNIKHSQSSQIYTTIGVFNIRVAEGPFDFGEELYPPESPKPISGEAKAPTEVPFELPGREALITISDLR